jgi:hypothetical protein
MKNPGKPMVGILQSDPPHEPVYFVTLLQKQFGEI